MPTVLDTLVLELQLQRTDFNRSVTEIKDKFDKLQKELVKGTKEVGEQSEKTTLAVAGLTRGFAALFAAMAAVAGTSALKGFVERISTVDSALGRLASNLATSPQNISAWGQAVERVGGNANAAAGSFQSLYDKVWRLTNLGENVGTPFWMGLGKGGTADKFMKTKDSFERMMIIAETIQNIAKKYGRDQAAAYGRNAFGLDEGSINLILLKGPQLRQYLEDIKRKTTPSDADIKAAERLQDAWISLSLTAVDFGRKLQTALEPFLERVIKGTEKWIEKLDKDAIAKAIENIATKVAGADGQRILKFFERMMWLTEGIARLVGIIAATGSAIVDWASGKEPSEPPSPRGVNDFRSAGSGGGSGNAPTGVGVDNGVGVGDGANAPPQNPSAPQSEDNSWGQWFRNSRLGRWWYGDTASPAQGAGGGDLGSQSGNAGGGLVSPVTGTFAGGGGSQWGASRGWRRHSGTDWQAASGSAAVAMTGGTVTFVGNDPGGYDHYIVIRDDDGKTYRRYATHGPISPGLKVGSHVEQGARIGTIGRGHLHYEEIPEMLNGKPNPAFGQFQRNGNATTQNQHGTQRPVQGLPYNTAVQAGKPLFPKSAEPAAPPAPAPQQEQESTLSRIWNWIKNPPPPSDRGTKDFASRKVDGARADGGPVDAGKSYIVGERGPEIFVPRRRGAIIPNAMLSGAYLAHSYNNRSYDYSTRTNSNQTIGSVNVNLVHNQDGQFARDLRPAMDNFMHGPAWNDGAH